MQAPKGLSIFTSDKFTIVVEKNVRLQVAHLKGSLGRILMLGQIV